MSPTQRKIKATFKRQEKEKPDIDFKNFDQITKYTKSDLNKLIYQLMNVEIANKIEHVFSQVDSSWLPQEFKDNHQNFTNMIIN